MPRHRSSAAPLAWWYVALIVYASLYPFNGWRLPGLSPFAFLILPWPHWWTWFDLVINVLGYLPFGALVFGAQVRGGRAVRPSLAMAVGVGTGVSLAMELLQNFLPQRVSSNVDLATNALGALAGAALGWAVHVCGGVERWQVARDRWLIARSAGGIALLLLWPIGLLFPLPVPLGQGQVLDHLQDLFVRAAEGTSIAPWLQGWADAEPKPSLSPAGEFALVALGLLAPCMIAFSIARPGWHRLVLVLGALALGAATTTLSTALNFNPEHLLAWSTPRALAALAAGALIATALSRVPVRGTTGVGLIVMTALVTLVAQAPADPYFSQSLQLWEQGRFIRFHGAARWVGWLWPYAAIVYLLARLGARDAPADGGAPGRPTKMPA
ncbi:MAG TPA: VanZ family protein [Burkholderiaceae bacterium]|jgi:VanZ family protein